MKLFQIYILLLLSITQPYTVFSAEGEYQVKAAMVFNFAKFIEWPPGTLGSDNKLIFCSAGKSGILEAAQLLQGKQIKGRTLTVRQISRPEDIAGCHILYIPQSEISRLTNYLQHASHSSILTVSDIDHFASAGGIIGFYEEDRKVRFEINPEAAQKGKLQISSHLMKLAKIVR